MDLDWRHLIGAVLLVMLVVVGGLVYEASRPCSGALTADALEGQAPDEATVVPYAELPENEHVATILQRAVGSDTRRSISLSPSERQQLLRDLSSFPRFGDSWYVHYRNTTVSMTSWCLDKG